MLVLCNCDNNLRHAVHFRVKKISMSVSDTILGDYNYYHHDLSVTSSELQLKTYAIIFGITLTIIERHLQP